MKLSPSRGNRKLSVFYRIRYCTFYIPEEEEANELTFNFSFDKELTCASFLTRTPSQYEVQALTKTVIWQISYHNLQRVYHETKVGNYIGRLASEKLFLTKVNVNFLY